MATVALAVLGIIAALAALWIFRLTPEERAARKRGQHTRAILAEFGMTLAEDTPAIKDETAEIPHVNIPTPIAQPKRKRASPKRRKKTVQRKKR